MKDGMVGAASDVKKFQTQFNQSFLVGLERGRVGLADFGQQLLSAGDAAGLGASQLARMAEASGIFTDAQITAARATADGAAKAHELAQAVADGSMTTYEAGQAFREFANENRVLATDMNAVANASLAMGAAFGTIAAAGASAIRSTTQLAARVETLGVVTAVMGKNIGMTEGQVRSLEKSIQAQGITTQASRQAIAQMIQAEIDLANATQLARLAQDAAVISGENSSEAFSQLVTVIASGNVVMARRMGLLVDFQGAYEREAEALGKSSQALTEQQKVQIRTNEVLRKGETIAGAYSAAMDTAGKKAASLARLQEEAALAIGETFLPAYGSLIDVTGDALKAFNDLEDGQKQAAGEALGYATAIAAANAATFLSVGTFIKAKAALDAMAVSLGLASKAALALNLALPTAAITLTAIAGLKLVEVNRQVKESTEDVRDAWAKMLDAQVASGANAGVISDTFLKRQEEVRRILEDTNPLVRMFLGNQENLTGSYAQLEAALRKTSGSYEEYRTNLDKVAKANGMLIDENGRLIQSMNAQGIAGQKVVESQFALSEAAYRGLEAAQKLGDAYNDVGKAQVGVRETLTSTAVSVDDLSTQLQALQEVISGRLGPEYEAFISKQNDLKNSSGELRAKIAELEGMQYRTAEQQAQLDDLVMQLAGVNIALAENAAAHEDSTRRIVFGLVAQRAAMDGLTQDELTMLNDIAFAWGIVDKRTWEVTNSINQAFAMLAQGASLKEVERQILAIGDAAVRASGDYYIRFLVEVQGLDPADELGEKMARKGFIDNYVPSFRPTQPTSSPLSGLGGGGGGGGGGRSAVTTASVQGPAPKTALQIAMETAQAAASAGSTAASILQRQTIDPLKKQLDAINKLMVPGHIDIMAMERRVELERKRAEMTEKVARAEAQVLELQKQQDRLNMLQSQLRLLDLIRENKLDAGDILQGLKIGTADMGEIVEAMARAVEMLVGKAEEELGIASPSKKAEWMMRMYWAGAVKGIEGGLPQVQQAMSGALNHLMPMPSDIPAPGWPGGGYLRPAYDERQPYGSAGGGGVLVEKIEINLDIENLADHLDIDQLGYKLARQIEYKMRTV